MSVEPYLSDPASIYQQSFAIIERETDLHRFPDELRPMVVRVIHACGMVDVASTLAFDGDVAGNCRRAIERGGVILCDVEMVRSGIMQSRLPVGARAVCTLSSVKAATDGRTRTAKAVEAWVPMLEGAVCVIGNAPTALFRLMELIEAGAGKPASILAFPVGFVGAVESKQALIDADLGVPYLTLPGRRGGSAMAAASVNAVIDHAH